MNNNQKLVLVLAAGVVLVMLLFPPFHVQIRGVTFNMGYAFILDPPKRGSVPASVNTGMLLVQWIAVFILAAFGYFLSKSSNNSVGHIEHSQQKPFTPSPKVAINGLPPNQSAASPQLGDTYHPWRRFFARTVDLWTLGLVLLYLFARLIGHIAGTYLPVQYETQLLSIFTNPLTWAIILSLIWVPVEAGLLTMFGTTPAKWLFGIRVLAQDGNRLSIGKALERSILVLIQGLGLGIPIVALFTQLFAYSRLTKTGTTLWDRSTDAVVTHQEWGFFRTVACVITVLGVLVILALVNSIGNQANG